MTDLPYFLELIQKNSLICRAVAGYAISERDLEEYNYTEAGPGKVRLKDFRLNEDENFNDVNISITKYGTLIDFIGDDLKYFENMRLYFNSGRFAKTKPVMVFQGKEFSVRGKKTEKYTMMQRSVHGTVFQSDLYGCKISLGFFELR